MAKEQAASESKLYFVDFDASYCATCRNMDQSTYMDPILAQYMDDNVVALRLDVQDFDGVMWSQQYDVEALPTMLVFNNKGKLVKRLVGYQSAADLLKEFKSAQISSAIGQPSSNNLVNTSVVPNEPTPNSTVGSTTNTTNSWVGSTVQEEEEAPNPSRK